jgi:hypothetical protein
LRSRTLFPRNVVAQQIETFFWQNWHLKKIIKLQDFLLWAMLKFVYSRPSENQILKRYNHSYLLNVKLFTILMDTLSSKNVFYFSSVLELIESQEFFLLWSYWQWSFKIHFPSFIVESFHGCTVCESWSTKVLYFST